MAAPASFVLNLKTCRYLLKFSYIGTKYKGVQRLTRRSEIDFDDGSIQCAIENALNSALRPLYGSRLALSSRTDAGVHAYQNSANVDLTHPFGDTLYKPSFITDATNRVLASNNEEITIVDTILVPSYFHSRANAQWRSYVYRIAMVKQASSTSLQQVQYRNLRSHLPLSQINRSHIVGSLDLDSIQKAIELFKGEHNFASFCTRNKANKDKSTVKTIDEFRISQCHPLSSFEQLNPLYSSIEFYEFYIKSKSFLYNQVRRMVGSALDVGIGRLTLSDIETMLAVPNHRPSLISEMVPACGLYLSEIGYLDEDLILHDNFMEYSPKAHYHDDTFERDSDLDE